MSDSLWPHGLQHTRLPCPSPSPRVCSNSCPLNRWCHPTISSSVTPSSSSPPSFPALRLLYQLPEAFTTKPYRWGVLNNRHLFAHCCGSWTSEIRVSSFGSLWRRWGKNAFQASVLDLDMTVFSLYLPSLCMCMYPNCPFKERHQSRWIKVNLNNLHSNWMLLSQGSVCAFSAMSDSFWPMDCSPPGSSVHGISQARILEWIAVSFSRGSSGPRDQTQASCIGKWSLYHWATWEAHGTLIHC